jgi:hypothetical protein
MCGKASPFHEGATLLRLRLSLFRGGGIASMSFNGFRKGKKPFRTSDGAAFRLRLMEPIPSLGVFQQSLPTERANDLHQLS